MRIQGVIIMAILTVGTMLSAADIQLPKPQTSGGAPLLTTLAKRSTNREMDPSKSLSMQQLSDLLWAAIGINRPDGRRTAPTAMNRQEITLYVVMPTVAYRYEPAENKLVEVATEPTKLNNNAAVELVFVVDQSKQSRETLCAVDCGFVGQNIYLYCAANDLATVFRATFDAVGMKKLLKLEGSQVPMYSQPVGFPK